VIGKRATHCFVILPWPTGAGVSCIAPSASTKPASSMTSVFWPDNASIYATGAGFDRPCEPVASSSLPHAATPSVTRATVASAAIERNM